jgi:pilus assembly protein CpaF
MTGPNPFGFAAQEKRAAQPAAPRAEAASRASQSGADFFADDDEEGAALVRARNANMLPEQRREASIEELIERNIDKLRREYPTGGIKASRYITSDILLRAPRGYFDKYENDVQLAVVSVQTTLADDKKSDVIAEAQANPLDDAQQDLAYRTIYAAALNYLTRLNYRNVEKQIVIYLICVEILGLGRLDSLWRDRRIDEIICNGPKDIQIEIRGELYKVPGCTFRDAEHLQGLIERLYRSVGKTLSRNTPQVKGRLHDNSRMFAVHTSVAPQGPNFNIRRHPEKIWTPNDHVELGSASPELMSFIGNLIYKGCSFVVIGGTSTGKTSLLNSLTGFYRPKQRILTLEDNIEMKPNPNKYLAAAMECRPPVPDRPDDKGVTMRDLVKGAMQLNPAVIIIGEVTDGAAYDLAQALNTGHAGASTIHANSEYDGIYRIASLIAQGELVSMEGALPLIAAAFDFIIHVEHFPVDGTRRIASVSEVAPYPVRPKDGGDMILPVHPLWKFQADPVLTDGKVTGKWVQTGQISEHRRQRRHLDIERDLTWEELKVLSRVEGQESIASDKK